MDKAAYLKVAEEMTIRDAVELAHQLGFLCDPNVNDARFKAAQEWLENYFLKGD